MKKNIDKDIDISKLIALALTDSISEEEEERLECWIQEKESRRVLMEELKNGNDKDRRQEIIHRIDLKEEWSRFENTINKETKVRRLFWINVLKYVAVIALPILMGAYLFLQIDTKEYYVSHAPVEIQPGVKNAHLVLSNGESIELGEEDVDLKTKGEVGVHIENKNKALSYEPIEKSKGVLRYNYLIVGNGEEYQLTLSDGTKVWLNSESKLKYPVQFANDVRRVELEGEGYFEVSKNLDVPFVVNTKQMDIEVLGTSFNVSAYQDEDLVKATLVEGSVKIVANYGEENPRVIKPDQQAILDVMTKKVVVKQVDAQLYSKWREGLFVFEEEQLEEIMLTLSRWYNIRVFFQNDAVRHLKFSGKLPRFKTCNELLEMIEKTAEVKFEVKNNENVIIKAN